MVKHITVIEQRYAAQTRYASSRGDSEPLRLPNARLVAADRVDDTGTIDDLRGRLAEAGRPSDEFLGALGGDALGRPTDWAGYEVTVRFRLHRFAAHIVLPTT